MPGSGQILFREWGGGGYSWVVKFKVPSPEQLFIFRGGLFLGILGIFSFSGGGVLLVSQTPKCQALANFSFPGGGDCWGEGKEESTQE